MKNNKKNITIILIIIFTLILIFCLKIDFWNINQVNYKNSEINSLNKSIKWVKSNWQKSIINLIYDWWIIDFSKIKTDELYICSNWFLDKNSLKNIDIFSWKSIIFNCLNNYWVPPEMILDNNDFEKILSYSWSVYLFLSDFNEEKILKFKNSKLSSLEICWALNQQLFWKILRINKNLLPFWLNWVCSWTDFKNDIWILDLYSLDWKTNIKLEDFTLENTKNLILDIPQNYNIKNIKIGNFYKIYSQNLYAIDLQTKNLVLYFDYFTNERKKEEIQYFIDNIWKFSWEKIYIQMFDIKKYFTINQAKELINNIWDFQLIIEDSSFFEAKEYRDLFINNSKIIIK